MTLMKNARADEYRGLVQTGAPGLQGPFQHIMSEEQAAELKRLSTEARDPQAFDPTLDPDEAARRIAALQAKLALLGSEEHTD
jgi:Protein of unknown function (DUF3072)